MARKIKFALEMKDGVDVRRNLEELREHFDMEKVVGHFLSGKLVKWLEDRYYDDEVAKINQLNKDDPNFHRQLCAALGVEYTGGEDLDVEQLERLNEKRRTLQEMTDDEKIISQASETALNQEDLADLLDMDTPTIYLCGEKFNVPIRVANKKYIGILGTPTVTISANGKADTDAKKIFFENVRLPWSVEEKSTPVSEEKAAPVVAASPYHEELVDTFKTIFGYDKVWRVVDNGLLKEVSHGFSDREKKIILAKLGLPKKYDENKIIHVSATSDRSKGWAITDDGIYVMGDDFNFKPIIPLYVLNYIPYKEIDNAKADDFHKCLTVIKLVGCGGGSDTEFRLGIVRYSEEPSIKYELCKNIAEFLNIAKEIVK